MPSKFVTVRRWQMFVAFIAVTASFVFGLAAVKRSVDAERHARQSEGRARVARLREAHHIDVLSCQSRHNLAVALEKENAALTLAEGTAINQAVHAKRPPDVTARQWERALRNARHLVANLKTAGRLASAADCRAPPPKLTGP